LGSQGVEDLAKSGTDVPVESVLSHLGNEDDMMTCSPTLNG
jgi:hypothetical protein